MFLRAKTGDVGFVHGTGWLQRSIRWAERRKNEPPSFANHTLLFTTDGIVAPFINTEVTGAVPVGMQAKAVEALWHVEHHPWYKAHRGDSGSRIRVYRPNFLTPSERINVVDVALTHVGERYGWWKLFTHLGRKITGINFPDLLFIDSRPICSYLVADAFDECGYWDAFGEELEPQAQDPDDQCDYCEWSSYASDLEWGYVGETTIK